MPSPTAKPQNASSPFCFTCGGLIWRFQGLLIHTVPSVASIAMLLQVAEAYKSSEHSWNGITHSCLHRHEDTITSHICLRIRHQQSTTSMSCNCRRRECRRTHSAHARHRQPDGDSRGCHRERGLWQIHHGRRAHTLHAGRRPRPGTLKSV